MTLSDKRAELLAWFAAEMAAKLELRQDRGDNWRDKGAGWLLRAITDDLGEIDELQAAIEDEGWANVIEEAADVAIYCAFIADMARGMMGEEAGNE